MSAAHQLQLKDHLPAINELDENSAEKKRNVGAL